MNSHDIAKVSWQNDTLKSERLFRLLDGGFSTILRPTPAGWAFLRQYCVQMDATTWYPTVLPSKNIEDLRPLFKNQIITLVGKGPSLDRVTKETFIHNGPVICINEAIHKVESLEINNPLYCIQQDAVLADKCKPKQAAIFVSLTGQYFYAKYENKYIYNPRDYISTTSTLSALMAMKISKRLGAISFHMVAFDSCTTGSIEYAKCIGRPAEYGSDPTRLLSHRRRFEEEAKGLTISFV